MTIICPYRSGLDIELRCDELRANHAIIGHHSNDSNGIIECPACKDRSQITVNYCATLSYQHAN